MSPTGGLFDHYELEEKTTHVFFHSSFFFSSSSFCPPKPSFSQAFDLPQRKLQRHRQQHHYQQEQEQQQQQPLQNTARKRKTLSRSKSLFFDSPSAKRQLSQVQGRGGGGGVVSCSSSGLHYKSFFSLCSIPEHAQVEGEDQVNLKSSRNLSSRMAADEEQICHRSPVSFDNGYRKVIRVTTPTPPSKTESNPSKQQLDSNFIVNDGLLNPTDEKDKNELMPPPTYPCPPPPQNNCCSLAEKPCESFLQPRRNCLNRSVVSYASLFLGFTLNLVCFLLKVAVSFSSVVMFLICLLLLVMNFTSDV